MADQDVEKYMLDTNIFNNILKMKIEISIFKNVEIYVTHIQKDEIGDTKCDRLRRLLLEKFNEIGASNIPTDTAIWGDSRWGEAKWSTNDGIYDGLLKKIQILDKKNRKKKNYKNQTRDARIAETAIKNDFTLITSDKNLKIAAQAFGCKVLSGEVFEIR